MAIKTIENDYIRAAVNEHGAEIISLFDKKKNKELIWCGDAKFWNRHSPVLFPFVGKVNGGVYHFDGKEYSMGQHGFARDKDFKCIDLPTDMTKIVFLLSSDDETRKVYPFDFELYITYELFDSEIAVSWEVANTDVKDMFFSIGAHPAFNCPIAEGTDKEDYYVFLADENGKGIENLQYVLIDKESEAVDVKHKHTLMTEKGYLRISENLFENDALIFDDNQIKNASLCLPDKSSYVTIDCSSFPSFGLWSKPNSNAPFICLEPWIGRCDNKGFDGDLCEKYGETKVLSGDSFSASYLIKI